jgi:APA family basic amino acid/polyamine antiporter
VGSSKQIGFWAGTALVVGNMVGSGVFLLPATLAFYGGISLIGWICASVGSILLALVFGKLAQLSPNSNGGPYAYTRAGLGEFPGFLVAWGYWISIWCTNAAIAVALVGYLKVFFPVLGTSPIAAVITGLCFIWLFTWINSKNLKTVGIVQLITTIIKVIPILLIGFVGVFYLKSDHFLPFNNSGESNWSAITATTTLALFAFLGMESATIPGGRMKQKTIKRATIMGTSFTIILYLLSAIAIMGLIPPESLSKSSAPFADAAQLFWGDAGRYIVALGAIIATMGALNGWILIQGQIPMAASQDKLFPKIFGKTNSNQSPILGIVISSLLVSALMMLNYSKSFVEAFTFMMKLSTLSVLTPYLFSTACLALLLFEKRSKGYVTYLGIAFLAFCFSMWIIVGCGYETVFWGFFLLMMGIPFYVWLRKK